MISFLTFNTFIAQDVLIFFYYIGAILVPVVLYYYKNKTLKYLHKKGLYVSLDAKDKKRAFVILIVVFLCAEICWRMMFEAMIGYFDIHDYLYEISKKL